MSSTYIDIHVLHTVPPSNLNRDDTGSPKSAMYGGVRRSRVSSQAWKRATRAAYKDELDTTDLAYRTKRVVELVCAQIGQQAPDMPDAERRERTMGVLKAAGLTPKTPRVKKGSEVAAADLMEVTDYLIFFSARQIDQIAELALATEPGKAVPKADAIRAADTAHGIEVALFGRMVADNKDLSVDASVQVAHAISTHAVDEEQDYFTAVDDKNPEDETGAGMLGTVEFNSATLYRYATINVEGLRANLGDDAATLRAVQAFVRAFALSMPTGKQNTFANRTVPDAVVVMVRRGQPVNLVGAFEDAVATSGGFVRGSAEALARHAGELSSFVRDPEHTWVVRTGDTTEALAGIGDSVSLDDLVSRLEGAVQGA